MADYTLPLYDTPKTWINNASAKGWDWNKITTAGKPSEEALADFLQSKEDEDFWPHLTPSEWREIVQLQKEVADNIKHVEESGNAGMIKGEGQDNDVTIPTNPGSSWQQYKKVLIDGDFKEETIAEIEASTLKTLKRLNDDTMGKDPVKGLVVGNVQSGKTANMAALMAMAADWGWNMFIILSGTIENLRKQTQNRLYNDLNNPGNLVWISFDHLEKGAPIGSRAQDLKFGERSKQRYFNVCLKNSTRLSNLIQWLQADPNSQKQMKILVIDDESDQASVNTANVNDETAERKKINGLIVNLVSGKDEKGNPAKAQYKAMNYIGYTATPYANILNESSKESLYPGNFISTLAVSNEYFGPQQIFGYTGHSVYFSGLDIVRTVPDSELSEINAVHNGDVSCIPDSLKDSICWFLCGAACMRIWGYKKPISMLIHTSQKTDHHEYVTKAVKSWIEQTPRTVIQSLTKSVWCNETARFTKASFRSQYPEYGRADIDINDYPDFNDVWNHISTILDDGIQNIKLNEEGELTYNKGIHLCTDNCMNNGITDDGEYVRLAYPDKNHMPSPAPVFIVVGGATLSRGLTIEGLISTFFLRSVKQADTLMQMGRWFGYRKSYELLPRIWLTDRTRDQFKFLAELDQELRYEIYSMDVQGKKPIDYGVKVKNTPSAQLIKITAKNKMQKATPADYDYTGATSQTYLFDNDAAKLQANIDATESFIGGLGTPWADKAKNKQAKYNEVWRGIKYADVKTYLANFNFNQRLSVFNNMAPLLQWIQNVTDEGKLGDWDIVVAGKKDSADGEWPLPCGTVINMVNRSRKHCDDASVIDIGVLSKPQDILSDIDLDEITDPQIKTDTAWYLEGNTSKGLPVIRDRAALETVPQLIIYRINKDSKAGSQGSREDLNAPCDLIGLVMHIPGGKNGTSYASSLTIDLGNGGFMAKSDVEIN